MRQRTFLPLGHTLVELVIAVALGLVVTVGAVSLYRSQRAAFGRAGDAIQIREAGLTALTLIGQQIQMTGFMPADLPQPQQKRTLFGCSAARPTGADDNLACEALRADRTASRFATSAIACPRGRRLRASRLIVWARP